MGCDWYTIRVFQGLGYIITDLPYFRTDYEDNEKIKSLEEELEKLGSDYGCIIFSDSDDGEKVVNHLFVYDRRTVVWKSITLPGPYEITLNEHNTLWKKEGVLTQKYEKECLEMLEKVNVLKAVGYYSILTTMGIGELNYNSTQEKDETLKRFKTINSYNQYYGYNNL